jgi:predicted DNA binding CopG/RHH family protein
MKNSPKKYLNNKWDNRELGATEKYVRKASTKQETKLDDNLGLQTISIRLQKGLIDDLKKLAKIDGIGYQPYVRQLLMKHVRHEKNKQIKNM